MQYYPPIEERDTDELIVVANTTENYWLPETIELAKLELLKRNISVEEQLEKIRKWNEEFAELETGLQQAFKKKKKK